MAHPPYNCEDCGIYHMPWSLHQRWADWMDEHWHEVETLTASLRTAITDAIAGADPKVQRQALDRVLEEFLTTAADDPQF
jgi:hypothetical protein